MNASPDKTAGMFTSVLIANRGEIACRVIRTCRRLGIRTIAVYSDADRNALHVDMADEAHHIGPASSRDSYLNIDAVIAAARASGAEAIHPGYGFLSENADFAGKCADAGITFIGPPADAIAAMGSKSAAKARMEGAGVPILPGFHGDAQDDRTLIKEAGRIGFPVLIKPSAGGGGRGMRRVDGKGGLAEALESARREAITGFGDDHLLIEKFLESPRHVEVQVFGDTKGNVIHLFERDCSVQRRHQKVLEEAPAPGVSDDLRAAMGAAAVAAAGAIAYVGAGTVEFLLDADGRFYFMEMNTRLQVEHPVTEMITGLDLVEWQLRVAGGEPLPLGQADLGIDGHAIEARLYAEDPANQFAPSPGRLIHLRLPSENTQVRIDSGVREGDEVTAYYDPLIAKIIAHGNDRPTALARLGAALAEVQVAGPATNTAFLSAVVRHPDFAAGKLQTGFVDANADALLPADSPPSPRHLACAAVAVLCDRTDAAAASASTSSDRHSPWRAASGWRLNDAATQEIVLGWGEDLRTVTVRSDCDGVVLSFDDADLSVALDRLGKDFSGTINGSPLQATVVRSNDTLTVFCDGLGHRIEIHDPVAEAAVQDTASGSLAAPMPGVVVDVAIASGQSVKRGDALIVLEAMKVEHTITAPADGTVEAVHFAKGDRVEEGVELLAFSPAA